jgi:hypothetical protein
MTQDQTLFIASIYDFNYGDRAVVGVADSLGRIEEMVEKYFDEDVVLTQVSIYYPYDNDPQVVYDKKVKDIGEGTFYTITVGRFKLNE